MAVVRALECIAGLWRSALSKNFEHADRLCAMRRTPVDGHCRAGLRMGLSAAVAGMAARAGRVSGGRALFPAVAAPLDGGRGCQGDRRVRVCPRTIETGVGAGSRQCGGWPARGAVSGGLSAMRAAGALEPHTLRGVHGVRRAQRGVYTVEFGLVFLVLFAVLYVILTYGLVFTAQQSLNLAAQDGARKALQWQNGSAALSARADAARDTALAQANWIALMSEAPVQVVVCSASGMLSAAAATQCSGEPLAADQIEVLVSFAYRQHPLIPLLPFLGDAMVPRQLQARATVYLGPANMPASGDS